MTVYRLVLRSAPHVLRPDRYKRLVAKKVRHSCSMLAALPAQPASGLQGLVKTVSRSKRPATGLKPKQQDFNTAAVQGVSPSKNDSLPLTNVPPAAASSATVNADVGAVPVVTILCRC